jgi:hypothetical protein
MHSEPVQSQPSNLMPIAAASSTQGVGVEHAAYEDGHMDAFKTIAIALVAGATALPLTANQSEARDGRNAAIVGGAVLGAVAGAAIANAANDDGGRYQQVRDWTYDDGYTDEYVRPRYGYRREYRRPTYVYVVPAPRYRDEYRSDYWRWQRPHHWHHRPAFYDGWGDDRY